MENQKELEGLRKSKGALEQLIAHHLKGQKAKKSYPHSLKLSFGILILIGHVAMQFNSLDKVLSLLPFMYC